MLWPLMSKEGNDQVTSLCCIPRWIRMEGIVTKPPKRLGKSRSLLLCWTLSMSFFDLFGDIILVESAGIWCRIHGLQQDLSKTLALDAFLHVLESWEYVRSERNKAEESEEWINWRSTHGQPLFWGVVWWSIMMVNYILRCVTVLYTIWLVVDLPLWKIWKSLGMIIPNIWENKKCSKPPTRYCSQKKIWGFGPSAIAFPIETWFGCGTRTWMRKSWWLQDNLAWSPGRSQRDMNGKDVSDVSTFWVDILMTYVWHMYDILIYINDILMTY